MSVLLTKLEVSLSDSELHVACTLANADAGEWRPEDGYAFGYHLFDEPTGTLVVDGERHPLDLAPAESRAMSVAIGVPPEPGEYEMFLSVMREHVAWFYEQAWPFVWIELSVDDEGVPTLKRWRISTIQDVKRRRSSRSMERAITRPLQSIWNNRGIIQTLVKRDVLGRYRGSFGGAFWAVLNPLLLMLTYFLVFGVILKSRFSGDPSRSGFALYFLAGMLPWLPFNEAIGRAPFSMLEHRTFIKKLLFPVETLPINLVVSGLVTEFFGLVLFLIALLIVRGGIPVTVLYLPLLIIPQVLFTAGLAWFLAALGVFFRDLAQINGFLLTLWFFITPICYEEKQIPSEFHALFAVNPMFVLVQSYRAILLENKAPDWFALSGVFVVSIAVFFLGHAWFYKLRKSFADLI